MTITSPPIARRPGCGCCFYVPPHLLRELAEHRHGITARNAKVFDESFAQTMQLRADRGGSNAVLGPDAPPPRTKLADEMLRRSPSHMFDCTHLTDLPGSPLDTAGQGGVGGEAIAAATAKVMEFYARVLGRTSIDRLGSPVISALNYGQNYQNAFWSGQMMVYGNGDQHVFVDFWKAPDVICHEITHGMTDHDSGLVYHDESGAVNESISDCFAAVFNQWVDRRPSADPAGWLLGAGILGPDAIAKGYTCMRDLVRPNASHCLAAQQNVYGNKDPDGDVHINSGIPNHAFALFARAVGGNAYDDPIRVWYSATTEQGLTANATIADFAAATIRAAAASHGTVPPADLSDALRKAWTAVEVPE